MVILLCIEYKQGSASIVNQDRLRSENDFGVSIGSSPRVLEVIRSGYRLLELFSVTIGLP